MRQHNSMPQMMATYLAAILTGLAGIVSLGVFGWFLSGVRRGWVELGFSPATALLWDALLCLLFFVQHSGMVRRQFRAWMESRIPGYLHGALYTWASAAALVLLCALWQTPEPAPLLVEGPARAVLAGLSVLGVGGFIWAFVALGSFDAFGARAMLARVHPQPAAPPQLTVKGPYRWVRHPFYFMAIVLLWASPDVSTDALLLNTLFTVWIALGARWEERDLTAAFGDAYRLQQREVPMLIPWKLARTAGRRLTAVNAPACSPQA